MTEGEEAQVVKLGEKNQSVWESLSESFSAEQKAGSQL